MAIEMAMNHAMNMTSAAAPAANAMVSSMSGSITHYMELLMTNQPWNLIFFMAIPVIMAELLVASEFFVTFNRLYDGTLRQFNKWLGTILGFYFLGIFIYLTTTVLPTIQWRGIIDILSVGLYLSGVIFLFGISLLELGVIGRNFSRENKMKTHFILIIGFLGVAHGAMIFGMANPALLP